MSEFIEEFLVPALQHSVDNVADGIANLNNIDVGIAMLFVLPIALVLIIKAIRARRETL